MENAQVASLNPLTVLDARGAAVPLGSLTQDRAAVLVFLRHFGWLHCAQQAAEFRAHQSEIEAAGGKLAFIGNGNPSQAAYFRTRVLGLPEAIAPGEPPIFTDPSLKTFEAAGMKYGALRTFSPGGIGQTFRALKAGFKQRKTMGDPWQQGGALVVKKGGEVAWAFSSDNPGDRVPIPEVVAELGKLAKA